MIPDDAGDLLPPPTENERKQILPRPKMVYENPLDRQRRREAGLVINRPKPKSENRPTAQWGGGSLERPG
jgi:hypothetical protein